MHKIDLNKPIQYCYSRFGFRGELNEEWLDCTLLDDAFTIQNSHFRVYKMETNQGNIIRYLDTANLTTLYWRNRPKPKVKIGVIVFRSKHPDHELFSVTWGDTDGTPYTTRDSVLKIYNSEYIVAEFEKEIKID